MNQRYSLVAQPSDTTVNEGDYLWGANSETGFYSRLFIFRKEAGKTSNHFSSIHDSKPFNERINNE